ncbi:PRC-barrel domain-containing protein [Jiella flava]|uniref:PRC-barrel domain-containing protein n=1 Tax=Jiella flava TaxID=2816857 RepID=A0A939JY32_9HYPH|nr:PRC-barrel domain-containing protein [Jiella flava]MBO0663996.1 PRC-barrel domain-containing protein [Jiella flava]
MQQPAATQPGDASGAATGDMQTQASASASGNYLKNLSADEYLASNLTGKSLYDGEGKDAKTIGDIQNFLIGSGGTVVAAVVNATVNDESKVVAVPFKQISWTMGENKEPRAVLTGGNQDLASAPTFQTKDEQKAAAEQSTASSAGGMTASGDASATASASNDTMTTSGDASQQAMAPKEGDQTAAGKTDRETATAEGSAGQYPASVGADQYLTENIIGADVYSGPGEDAKEVGGINDLVLASSGKVDAVVVGVGGFLGIGEKEVAAPFDQFQISRNEDGKPRLVAALTKEALEQAPKFEAKRSDQMAAADGQNAEQPAPSDGQMAAATGAAAGTAMEKAGTNMEQAANNAGQAMDNAADNAATEAKQAANNAGQAIDNAADKAVTATEQAANDAGQALGNAGDNVQQAAQNATNDQSDATTTASTGGDQRQGMTKVADDAQLTADDLMGTTVYGPNDASVGEIGDIALNAQGKVDAIIVDVGGFLGIGEKPVAVGMDNLNFMRDKSGKLYLYTNFTEDQLKNAPEYKKDSYAENRDTMRLEETNSNGAGMSSGQSDQDAAKPANN